MEREDEIHIPPHARKDIGRKALAAIHKLIREEAGVSADDPRTVCAGCTLIAADGLMAAAEDYADQTAKRLARENPMALLAALIKAADRNSVRV